MKQSSHSVVEGPYLRDILDQPRALQATLDDFQADASLFARIAKMRQHQHQRIVLTGMGSSLHALYPLEMMLAAQGENVTRLDTAELIYSMSALLTADSIIVAASQSGQSAETVHMLQQNAGRAKVIGVTNTAGSPLAEQADLVLLTHCGAEFSVSAKTYVGTLAALEVLGAAWCDVVAEAAFAELLQTPALVAAYLESWRENVASLAAQMEGVSQLFIVGRGRSLASCGTGALITKESTRSAAEAMSSAAFRHGPMELAGPRTMVLVMEGEAASRALNHKLVRDVREAGGRAERIGPTAELTALRLPELPARLLPILEILPIEMLTLAMAANAGFEAGCFLHASKVTMDE